jgi:hypothetical protein
MKTRVSPVNGRIEEQPNGGALFRPEKGETANRRGRPRKFMSKLRGDGYGRSEVNDAILVMLAMTEEELGSVFENPAATALEKTIASAVIKGIELGSLSAIESLLTRALGKPKETMTLSTEEKPKIILMINDGQGDREVAP